MKHDSATRLGGHRPTVLLTASSGWVIRNFVQTGFVSRISASADVWIATSEPLAPYFQQLLIAGRIAGTITLASKETLLSKCLRQAKKAILQARHDISTANFQWRRRARGPVSAILRGIAWRASRIVAATWQIRLLEAIERWLGFRQVPSMWPLPSLIINCSPFSFPDNEIQRNLQRHGVPAVAIIPSWDNPSSKGCILSRSNWVFVWGPNQKEEIERFYPSIDPGRVVMTGAPQFDHYSRPFPPAFERDRFLSTLLIRPSARVILYGTGNPRNHPGEPSVVAEIARAISSGRFGNAHLLVRCHPADNVLRYKALEEFDSVTVFPPSSSGFAQTVAANPRKVEATPHVLLSWVPPEEELYVLAAMLRHSEVCINVASTMTLDALAAGTPAINVRYDGAVNLPLLHSVKRFYSHHHYLPITRSGAVPLADSGAGLLRNIDEGLAKSRDIGDAGRVLLDRLILQPKGGAVSLMAQKVQDILGSAPSEPNR